MSKPVLIFGATGRVGGQAIQQLTAKGSSNVVGVVRNINKAKEKSYLSNIKLIEGDLTNPESIKQAVKDSGADQVFLYTAFGSKQGMPDTIDALKSSGIKHIVFLSSFTSGHQSLIDIKDAITMAHHPVEETIKASGLTYTFVRGGYFASNIINQWKSQIPSGTIRLVSLDTKLTFVTEEDLAALVVVALTSHTLDNQAISAVGNQLLTYRDVASILSRVLNKKLELVTITENEWKEKTKGSIPPPLQDSILRLIKFQESENKEGNGDQMKKILGRESMTFEEYAKKHKDEFLA